MMRLFSIHRISAILLTCLFSLCMSCTSPQPAISGKGYIHHVVIAWLKQPGSNKAQEQLIEATKSLRQIPGVVAVTVGKTFPSKRKVVDDSFDVALTVILEDRAALQSYQNHPLHVKVKKQQLKPLVQRYLVYNYID